MKPIPIGTPATYNGTTVICGGTHGRRINVRIPGKGFILVKIAELEIGTEQKKSLAPERRTSDALDLFEEKHPVGTTRYEDEKDQR